MQHRVMKDGERFAVSISESVVFAPRAAALPWCEDDGDGDGDDGDDEDGIFPLLLPPPKDVPSPENLVSCLTI